MARNLIVVVYKIEPSGEIHRTIDSLVDVTSATILFILSEYNLNIVNQIDKSLTTYKIVVDKTPGIYHAMNAGIQFYNDKSFNTLLFINGGDEIYGKVYNEVIPTLKDDCIYSFRTHQKYANVLFERPSLEAKRTIENAPHQGLIVSSKSNLPLFDVMEFKISADVEWQVSISIGYKIEYMDEILSIMYLGGVSNKPSLRSCRKRLVSQGPQRGVKEFVKLVLYRLLGPLRYYRFLSRNW